VNGNRTITNVALVGFMGTGKSTVGRHVAQELGFEFIDTDLLIENRLGVSISDVFARHGESVFRKFEHEVVLDLAYKNNLIIATGGGLVTYPGNIESLKTHALVICLWASADEIWERVKDHNHRPLLQTPDPMGKIQSLLAIREPFYREADVLIHTGLRSVREVAQQVIHHFYAFRNGQIEAPQPTPNNEAKAQ
jgi:shikimate kinase